MNMTKKQLQILNEMIKEYELLAKYNGGKDYEKYSLLCEICKEVKAKNTKSRWIDEGYYPPQGANCYRCSNCNQEYYSIDGVDFYHCPNCGAEMEVDDG